MSGSFGLIPLEWTTERLRLKVLDGTFAPQVLDFFKANAEFRQPWSALMDPAFLSLAAQRERLESERTLIEGGQMLKLWLFDRQDKAAATALGFVGVSNIVRGAFQSCHLGYEISARHLNQGYVTEALRRLIEIVFRDMRLHRIEANIMPRNARSIRVAEKLGFTYEGLSRKYLKINGAWEDHGHHVLLNEELERET